MTIQTIAGFCPETAIWKMLADVSLLLADSRQALSPQAIAIDGDAFLLVSTDEEDSRFRAPEDWSNENDRGNEQRQVWALGAIAYYMSSGHVVFGGNGGAYQKEHPAVALPVLQKAHQSLTPVIQQCLMADPKARPTLAELHDRALQGLATCQQAPRQVIPHHTEHTVKRHETTEEWPETMEP